MDDCSAHVCGANDHHEAIDSNVLASSYRVQMLRPHSMKSSLAYRVLCSEHCDNKVTSSQISQEFDLVVGDAVLGALRLQGTLHGRAYVHRRDSAPAAAALLKADLRASLRSRMEAVREEAEARGGEQHASALLSPPQQDTVMLWSMPVRVFMPTTVCPCKAPPARVPRPLTKNPEQASEEPVAPQCCSPARKFQGLGFSPNFQTREATLAWPSHR